MRRSTPRSLIPSASAWRRERTPCWRAASRSHASSALTIEYPTTGVRHVHRKRSPCSPPKRWGTRRQMLGAVVARAGKGRGPVKGLFMTSLRFELLADRTDVGCLLALGAIYDVEFEFLALVEGLVAVSGDRGEVYEHILPVGTGDEPVPLLVAEPLHRSLGQTYLLGTRRQPADPTVRETST